MVIKIKLEQGTWLAPSEEQATLDLGVIKFEPCFGWGDY